MAWRDIANRVDAAGVRVFGQTVTYTPAGDIAREITGAFDAETEIVDFVGGMEISTKVPTLGLHVDDLGFTPAAGDLVTVDAVDYEVSEPPEYDGPNVGVTLRLQRVPS